MPPLFKPWCARTSGWIEREFELEVVVDVKYTSSRRSEDMPDDYMYMSLEERFAYAEKLAEVVE